MDTTGGTPFSLQLTREETLEKLDTYGEWLGVSRGAARDSSETALEQRHQTRVPITDHEQKQERDRDEVFIFYCVVDGHREIGSDQ